MARRGQPRRLFSDRGTNFVGADNELKQALRSLDNNAIQRAMSHHRIEWEFNPPHASHRGGLWERLIRSTRNILRSLIKQQLLSDEALLTVFAEVERILNSRPLTPVSSDSRDPAALTPADLLLLQPNNQMPLGTFHKEDCLLKRVWRQAQYLSDVFWRRWTREYVPLLIQTQKWQRPSRNMRVGDVVLVADQNLPRGQWPLGLVEKTRLGRDGLVRQVTVRTAASTLERPITQLCLLEAALDDE
jgi:hypothetical protein